MSYGLINIIELMNHGKSTIRLDVIDYYYSDSDKFEQDKKPGLNIAFGITHYDDNFEAIDDLDYGEVIGEIKRWDGETVTTRTKINLRPCTYEELGLDEKDEISPDAKFYPAHKNSRRWLDLYWKKLKCYDEQVDIRGDYNSASVSHLHFYFQKCTERPTCKNDTEIEKFSTNLFYLHVHNSVRF